MFNSFGPKGVTSRIRGDENTQVALTRAKSALIVVLFKLKKCVVPAANGSRCTKLTYNSEGKRLHMSFDILV